MRIVEFLLAIIAVACVLAFGGVSTISISFMELGVGVLAIVCFWWKGWPGLSRGTVAILALVLMVPVLQIVPLPRPVVALVSPMRLAFQEQLPIPVNSASGAMPISVNAWATRVGWLRLTCYVLAFLIAFQLYKRRRQSALGYVMAIVGLFEAGYGLFQYLTGWPYVWTYATGLGRGTYVNRNHYAGLLEMVLPFVVAGIWFRAPWKHNTSYAIRWHNPFSPETAFWFTRLLLFAVVFTALVFSMSKMGIAAALTGLLLVTGIALVRSTKREGAAIALLLLALPAAYAIWIGLAPVAEHFELLGRPGSLEQERLPIWRDTLALIRDYPLLGTGLGTYRWSSLHYQSHLLNYIYDHAHNDYLEFAADIGIPAALLLFGSLWLVALKVARRALILERTQDRVLAAGCAGAMAAFLTHSLADFNLQIPANALIFAWIAGTAVALIQVSGSRLHASSSGFTSEGTGQGQD